MPPKKSSDNSVCGKIIVTSSEGERIGQWGGTECYLSQQTALGPCLVVRSSRHKKGAGTFFLLREIRQVLSGFLNEGKLTVVVHHGRCLCTVHIQTVEDVEELFSMATILQNRAQWKSIPRNVGSKRTRESGTDGGQDNLRDPEANQPMRIDHSALYQDDPVVESMDDVEGGIGERTASDTALPWAIKTAPSASSSATLPRMESDATAAAAGPTTSRVAPAFLLDEEGGHAAAVSHQLQGRAEAMLMKKKNATAAATSPTQRWSKEEQTALHHLLAGRNVFLTGSAGTGKTAWLMHVLHHVLPEQRSTVRVAPTATTGVAARLLGGQTIYAFAGIGRGEGTLEAVLQRVQSRHEVVRGWRQSDLLIIDEIGVLPGHIFALLDKVARTVRKQPEKPFGGLQLLCVGDFLQLPPVSRGGGEEVLMAFEIPAWKTCGFQHVQLRHNYRHRDDPTFEMACEDVRRGVFTTAVQTIVAACSGQVLEPRYGVSPTTLLCRLKDVEDHNQKALAAVETMHFHRYASDDYAAQPGAMLDSEFSLPSLLTLKVGAQVVLLASLPDEPRLANGDLGVVVGFQETTSGESLPIVRFLLRGLRKGSAGGGEDDDRNAAAATTPGTSALAPPSEMEVEVIIPRIKMEVRGKEDYVSMARTQIPLQLAWALTVHRVQGMTLAMAQAQLDRSFFEYGQAYVAISRVRRRGDLCLTAFDPSVIKAAPSAVAFYDRVFPLSPAEKEALKKRTIHQPS